MSKGHIEFLVLPDSQNALKLRVDFELEPENGWEQLGDCLAKCLQVACRQLGGDLYDVPSVDGNAGQLAEPWVNEHATFVLAKALSLQEVGHPVPFGMTSADPKQKPQTMSDLAWIQFCRERLGQHVHQYLQAIRDGAERASQQGTPGDER